MRAPFKARIIAWLSLKLGDEVRAVRELSPPAITVCTVLVKVVWNIQRSVVGWDIDFAAPWEANIAIVYVH